MHTALLDLAPTSPAGNLSQLALVVNLLCSVFIPLLTGLLAKRGAPSGLKLVLTLLLSAVAGVLTSTTIDSHTSWESVLLSIGSTFGAAMVAHRAYTVTGVTAAVQSVAPDFGIGPSAPAPTSTDGTPDVTSTANGGAPGGVVPAADPTSTDDPAVTSDPYATTPISPVDATVGNGTPGTDLTVSGTVTTVTAPHIEAAGGRLQYLPDAGEVHQLGAVMSPADDRDYAHEPVLKPSTVPASLDHGKGLVFPLLLNDKIGDCGIAAWLHALQVAIYLASGTVWTPTDAQALAFYEAIAGYRPGQPSTDTGVVIRDMLQWLVKAGILESYARVELDPASIREAIASGGFVISGYNLPLGAQNEGVHWTVPRTGKTPGSWGGHCVPEVGYNATRTFEVSWGQEGYATNGFEAEYREEAWSAVFSAKALAGNIAA